MTSLLGDNLTKLGGSIFYDHAENKLPKGLNQKVLVLDFEQTTSYKSNIT